MYAINTTKLMTTDYHTIGSEQILYAKIPIVPVKDVHKDQNATFSLFGLDIITEDNIYLKQRYEQTQDTNG